MAGGTVVGVANSNRSEFVTKSTVDSRQFLRACFPTARSTDRTLGRTVLFGRCDIPQSTMLKNAQVVDLCFTTLKVVLGVVHANVRDKND